MSSAHGSSRRYAAGSGSCGSNGAARNGASAAIGVTHGEIEVANDLPRNGPSGWDSNACRSRALQSLSSTTPKTWSSARSTGTGSPIALGVPIDESELELDVELRARAEDRRRVAVRAALAARPADRRPARDDRRGAPVVADRHVAPVRRQRVGAGPEDPPRVRRVMDRRPEVDVVGDRERRQQLDLAEREQLRLGVDPRQQPRDPLARRRPRRRARTP